MAESEGGDWKIRQKSYENIYQMMQNPTPELIVRMHSELPKYLSDPNSNCQRTALSICDLYFKATTDIDYAQIAHILLKKYIGVRQQTTDAAIPLINQCLQKDPEEVLSYLYEELNSPQQKNVLAVISIIVSHLATLKQKDIEEIQDIIDHVTPLLQHEDLKIRKEAKSAIASAQLVSGAELDGTLLNTGGGDDSTRASQTAYHLTDTNWPNLIQSKNWKERKAGYEELLHTLSESTSLAKIEHDFLIQAGSEKHIACMEIVANIIEKLALIFKTQLARKAREYIQPVINMMKEKRISRLNNLQAAFDAVALNICSSPYEAPFVENLMGMMKCKTTQLREEAVNFVLRNSTIQPTPSVIQQLQKLTTDPNQTVRELATKAIEKFAPKAEPKTPAPVQLEADPKPQRKSRLRSPEPRRSARRRSVVQNWKMIWESWVNPETNSLLSDQTWQNVTKGLSQLRREYEIDPSQNSAIVAALATLFSEKTFTPKVMKELMNNILFYMKAEPEKLNDDALTCVVNFCIAKIIDKRFEAPLFEILDFAAETNSGQFVFQIMYQKLDVKNPAQPAHIAQYFAHHLSVYGLDSGINIEEFSNQIKPLFTHGDGSVRKAAHECVKAVAAIDQDAAAEYFKYVKAPQTPKEDIPKPHDPPRVRSEIPVPKKRSQSPRNHSPPRSFIPQHVLQNIAKTASSPDCKKALEEAEQIMMKAATAGKKIPASEFVEYFNRLRAWFKDSNTTFILLAVKTVTLALKIVIPEQLETIDAEFFYDLFLLLNISQKIIRQATIGALTQLSMIYPRLVIDFFLPIANKFNIEGRRFAVIFIRDMDFEMTTHEFGPFIVTCLADKSDDFRDAATPLIERFLSLPDAMEEAIRIADSFPPAKKNLVIERLKAFSNSSIQPETPKQQDGTSVLLLDDDDEEEEEEEAFLKAKPTKADRDRRRATIDPLLPFKILNSDDKPTKLGDLVKLILNEYFNLPNPMTIHSMIGLFANLASTEFSSFSLVFDIVALWWANEVLFSKVSEGFDELIAFMIEIIDYLKTNKRTLVKFEVMIILPTILECLGRQEELWNKLAIPIIELCVEQDLLQILTMFLDMASSIYTIISTFKMLEQILNEGNAGPYVDELEQIVDKIWALIADDSQGDQRLTQIVIDFRQVLKKFKQGDEEEEEAFEEEEEEHTELVLEIGEQTADEHPLSPPKQLAHSPEPRVPVHTKFSQIGISDEITSMLDAHMLDIYQWISDIHTGDSHAVITALKTISGQLSADWKVFEPHIDSLMLVLIEKIHLQFAQTESGTRLVKYIGYCLLKLFSETGLGILIKQPFYDQLLNDLITHLSNGINVEVIYQVLNAILVKLIEDKPVYSFNAFLKAVARYKDTAQISEKWIKLAVKCLEASGAKICELQNERFASQVLVLIDQFFKENDVAELNANPLGVKITRAITAIVNNIQKVFPETIRLTRDLEAGSIVLKMIMPQGPSGSDIVRTPPLLRPNRSK